MMNLAHALDIAVAAARTAAQHLRAEFFRPDGPRGDAGHCPADGEAEDLIRAALREAFPDHGIVGEERGAEDRHAPSAEHPLWLVDPNDGTADFQRGRRGASVSIALVVRGAPVLGVVLAHTAPLGGEDLSCWAEGQGPAQRNGRPLRPLVAGGLAAGDVVLASGSAAARARAHAAAVAPARFRPQASAAYRLALVAAGSARGAVSLHAPRALDVAAGHALLRGVGGVLVDAAGRELAYGPDGAGGVPACYAGAPQVAAALAARDWSAASRGPIERAELAEPVPGRLEQDVERLRRAQGAIVGLLAGDALRAGDGRGRRALELELLVGQPTGAGEQALALARALLASGRYDAGRAAEAYAAWRRSGPVEPEVPGSALARIAPLGVQGWAAPAAELAARARADAALTDPDAAQQDASAILAAAVALAVRGGGSAAEVAGEAERVADALAVAGPVRAVLAAARAGSPPPAQGGLGPLQEAFSALRHAASFEQALVETVRRGGDAAVTGALYGAAHGVLAIEPPWREAVLSAWPLAGIPGVHHPRPPPCWPVDALVIAERLLAG